MTTLGSHALLKSQGSRTAAEFNEHVAQLRRRSLAEAGPFSFVAADAHTIVVCEDERVVNAVVRSPPVSTVTTAAKSSACRPPSLRLALPGTRSSPT